MVLLVSVLVACTRVDSTERCIETRYGDVVNENMDTGLNATFITDAECFKLTDLAFPVDGSAERISAVTRAPNPVTIEGDVAIIYAFDPSTIMDVFRAKRSQAAAEVEIYNAVREGYRNAIAQWTVEQVFSDQRASMGDSVRMAIQRKIGDRAIIRNVFVRELRLPPVIEEARIAAAKQAQIADSVRQQFAIDSLRNRTALMTAETNARRVQLEAAAYAQDPALLQLKVAEQMSRICANAQQCILGVSVMDRLMTTAAR